MTYYKQTQTGRIMILLTILGGIGSVFAFSQSGLPAHHPALWVLTSVLLVTAFVVFLFASLTVHVDDKKLSIWFGPGIIRRSWSISEIRNIRVVENRWWYGWGVHYTPHGWLYNVSGFNAVEIKMDNGSTVRIGTEEPDALEAAIRQAIRSH